MISPIDLHIHSTGSDGEDSPEIIVQKAKNSGVQIIAITDHDSISSLEIAATECDKIGITFVNGLELSVTYYHPLYQKGEKSLGLHLLGYGFERTNENLRRVLEENRDYRIWRAGEIVKKVNAVLSQENQPVITKNEFNDYLLASVKGSLGRPHLAQLLIKKGIVTTIREAFDNYLIQCNVPKKKISFEEGSELIRQAGGYVVLAHPHGDKNYSLLKITTDINQQAKVIQSMLPQIDGLECFYWEHTDSEAQQYVQLATELRLKITLGSDHHGGPEKDRIGKFLVPDSVMEFSNQLFLIR